MRSLIAQPITLREYRSTITAKYSQPSAVYKVGDAAHFRFGAAAAKFCWSRLPATGSEYREFVAALSFRAALARSPWLPHRGGDRLAIAE
ncbi:hypothetical protein GCM10027514_42260 [Azotobacter armeniacus]